MAFRNFTIVFLVAVIMQVNIHLHLDCLKTIFRESSKSVDISRVKQSCKTVKDENQLIDKYIVF